MEHHHDHCCEHEHEHEHSHMPNKYAEALEMYNTHIHDEDVQRIVKQLLDEHLEKNNTLEVKKLLFN